MDKTILIVLGAVIILGLGYYFWSTSSMSDQSVNTSTPTSASTPTASTPAASSY